MDLTTEAVRLGLDVSQTQAWMASANIARADVPGAGVYRASFSDALGALQQAAMQAPDAGQVLNAIHSDTLRAEIREVPAGANGVQLDDQVAALNLASTTYTALSNGLSRHFALMQMAIMGS